jgi:type IV pilus assembly protein PilY1
VVDDDTNPANWTANSTFLDLTPNPPGLSNGQPITAAPSGALDPYGNRWIFVGTGRFFGLSDKLDTDQQSYYGIKEPVDGAGDPTWGTVSRAGMLDVSNAAVIEGGQDVNGVAGVTNWAGLLSQTDTYSGWVMDFSESAERNLGQATFLGDILTFSSFVPSQDPCNIHGHSNLYAVY